MNTDGYRMDEFEGSTVSEIREETKKSGSKSPLSSTKAIYCETLTKHPQTKAQPLNWENRMKFVSRGSLLRAVHKARCDVDSMLKQSVCGSEISSHKTQLTASCSSPSQKRNLSLPSSNKGEEMTDRSNSSKKSNSMLCRSDLEFSCQNQQISEPNLSHERRRIKENCPSKSKVEEPQIAKNNQPLTKEELKWLGKNYVNRNGQPTFKKTNLSYQHVTEEKSFLLETKFPVEKNNNKKVHTEANELINRVQLREQQLWKQLAEMSISSHSPSVVSNGLEEHCEPFLTNVLPVWTVPDEAPNNQCQTDTFVIPHQEHELSIIRPENVLDFLDDEWFDNLLRAELEITKV